MALKLRPPLWHKHPCVANNLTRGERAADRLKAGFGSWPFLFILNGLIVAWVLFQLILGRSAFDPYPWLLLNICLSWLAAQQGGALQIASNRGDRIASEVALLTQQNTDKLVQQGVDLAAVNARQLQILTELQTLRNTINGDDSA